MTIPLTFLFLTMTEKEEKSIPGKNGIITTSSISRVSIANSSYSKKCGDSNQSLAADYMVFLIESNAKKAVNCLKKLIEAGDGWEIFARSMLLNFNNGSEINYSAETIL